MTHGTTLTWSILGNDYSSMVQSDIRGRGSALISQGIVLLHLKSDTAWAAVSGAGGAVGGAS